MSLGSITHTSLDGVVTSVAYSIDGEGCLVRSTNVKSVGAHVDPKSDVLDVSAQSPVAAALEQLEAYKMSGKQVAGNIDEIKAKILAAEPKQTEGEKAVAEAAVAAEAATCDY
eukprot:331841_1